LQSVRIGAVTELQLPDKLFFKIGEVAQIIGVKTHVLRYWEAEFTALRPMKTRGAHRVYRRRDVELAMLVKGMLQDDGLTIAGAKRKLRDYARERPANEAAPEPQIAPSTPMATAKVEAAQMVGVRADMLAIRRQLSDLLKALDAALDPNARPQTPELTATVTASVPSSVPLRTRR
jgi:DNA-binding transcriptional MerR regulator